MKCPHCLGFMAIDTCLNMEGDRNKVWIEEWRCFNSGEVFDSRTVGNILLQPQARHVWRTQAGGRCLVS